MFKVRYVVLFYLADLLSSGEKHQTNMLFANLPLAWPKLLPGTRTYPSSQTSRKRSLTVENTITDSEGLKKCHAVASMSFDWLWFEMLDVLLVQFGALTLATPRFSSVPSCHALLFVTLLFPTVFCCSLNI